MRRLATWLLTRLPRKDIMDREGERLYLSRFWLLGTETSRWALMLHQMHMPDDDACHHDHPWSFLTLILRAGYVEQVTRADGTEKTRCNLPGMVLWRRAEHTHRIHCLLSDSCWTLVLRFRKRRHWGFHSDTHGWLPWRRFIELRRTGVVWCEGGLSRPTAERRDDGKA